MPTPPRTLNRDAIAVLIDRFYTSVRADALLGPVFETLLQDRWDAHLARMVDFWCTASKIERSFRGNVFDKHMALPDIRLPHLLRWLRLWKAHTQALFAPGDAERLWDVALGVARVMHLGWFGNMPAAAELQAQAEQEAATVTA